MSPEIQFYKEVVDTVVGYNIEYLSLAVTIILFLGGAAYYFNVKPLKDKVEKQETEIKEGLAQIKHKLGTLNSLTSQQQLNLKNLEENFRTEISLTQAQTNQTVQDIDKAKKTFQDLMISQKERGDFQIRSLELQGKWNMHYLWYYQHVYWNSIDELTSYLTKSIEYKIPIVDNKLWFERVHKILNNILDDERSLFYEDDLVKLEGVLKLISGLTTEKIETTRLIFEIRKKHGPIGMSWN